MRTATTPSRVQRGVLIVGNQGSTIHGNRSVCEDLAESLAANRWHVIATSGKRSAIARVSDMLATAWRFRNDYDVAQVDVFSGRAMIWAEAVCWLLRRTRKPYVLTLHGGNLPRFSLRWPRRLKRLLRSAHVVTTPSSYLYESMSQYRDDLHTLPNPLDLTCYRFRLRERPQANLIWVRAFHNMYNPSLAARVVFNLRLEFPGVKLSMVGPDRNDGSLTEFINLVSRLDLSDRVAIHGIVPKAQIPIYLDDADIFINTSHVDNAPVSITEAMAAGLCVVSTNVGGIPYLLEHEKTGLLVPPDDPFALSAAVARLLNEPGLAARLSANARAKTQGFSKTVVLQQWEKILTGAIKRPTLAHPSVN